MREGWTIAELRARASQAERERDEAKGLLQKARSWVRDDQPLRKQIRAFLQGENRGEDRQDSVHVPLEVGQVFQGVAEDSDSELPEVQCEADVAPAAVAPLPTASLDPTNVVERLLDQEAELSALRQRLAEADEPWQTLDTAPRDGTYVRLWSGHEYEAHWRDRCRQWVDRSECCIFSPTHWRPNAKGPAAMHAAPQAQEAKEAKAKRMGAEIKEMARSVDWGTAFDRPQARETSK